MIDIDLVNLQVNLKDWIMLPDNCYPVLFLGFIIENEYDNVRIQLNKKYTPVNIIHKLKNDVKLGMGLKGVILKPNDNVKKLMSLIKEQEKNKINLVTYENLLNQFNFECKDTYKYFCAGMYPLDFNNLKSVCIDDFNTDKKIFQHLLNLDEKSFDFQKFSSLKLFILTV
jgi:hypothetical protein